MMKKDKTKEDEPFPDTPFSHFKMEMHNGDGLLDGQEGKKYFLQSCTMPVHVADSIYRELAKLPLQDRPPLAPRDTGFTARARRDFEFFSDDKNDFYMIGGVRFDAKPLTDPLRMMIYWANLRWNGEFDACIVNRYQDGFYTIGPHRDAADHLGKNNLVVTYSFGCTRDIHFTDANDNLSPPVFILPSTHGSVNVMGEDFQKYFFHSLVQEPRRRSTRFSVTLRRMKKAKDDRIKEESQMKGPTDKEQEEKT